MGLLALCALACTSPAPGGDSTRSSDPSGATNSFGGQRPATTFPEPDPGAVAAPEELAAVFTGCKAQEGRQDVWCGDLVFASFNRPKKKDDLPAGLVALRDLISEIPGSNVKVEGTMQKERFRETEVLTTRYRYTWEGREYIGQSFGRITDGGSAMTDCAAPASVPDGVERCRNLGLLALTVPLEQLNSFLQVEQGVPRPPARFDDPRRKCNRRDLPGTVAYSCKDGSGFMLLDPQKGAVSSRQLISTMGGQGTVEPAGEIDCTVSGTAARCQRFTCKGGPTGCELLLGRLGKEATAQEALCVIPPGKSELPWICQSTFGPLSSTKPGTPAKAPSSPKK